MFGLTNPISFSDYLQVYEMCVFRNNEPHPDNYITLQIWRRDSLYCEEYSWLIHKMTIQFCSCQFLIDICMNLNKFPLICIITPDYREGTCSLGALPNGTMGACAELCSSDGDCPSHHKCCSNGCGHVCMMPNSLPGTCLLSLITSIKWSYRS